MTNEFKPLEEPEAVCATCGHEEKDHILDVDAQPYRPHSPVMCWECFRDAATTSEECWHPFKPLEEPAADAVAAARLAQQFHEAYERLAPEFSYETRKASAVPWEDVPDNNKRLMTAVAGEIIAAAQAEAPRVAELEAALREIYEDQGLADWLEGEDDDYGEYELRRRKLVQRITRLLAPSTS